MCFFQELCNNIPFHKIEKHESIAYIMHEESAKGNEKILLQK